MSFIEVDHGPDGAPARFERPSAIVCARRPEAAAAALAALDAALAEGRWIAGYASYELGYAFEPRLASLMPEPRRLPLLEFGVFDGPAPVRPATPGGRLGPFAPGWSPRRLPGGLRAGDGVYRGGRHLSGEPDDAAARTLGGRSGGALRGAGRGAAGRAWRAGAHARGDDPVAVAGAASSGWTARAGSRPRR